MLVWLDFIVRLTCNVCRSVICNDRMQPFQNVLHRVYLSLSMSSKSICELYVLRSAKKLLCECLFITMSMPLCIPFPQSYYVTWWQQNFEQWCCVVKDTDNLWMFKSCLFQGVLSVLPTHPCWLSKEAPFCYKMSRLSSGKMMLAFWSIPTFCLWQQQLLNCSKAQLLAQPKYSPLTPKCNVHVFSQHPFVYLCASDLYKDFFHSIYLIISKLLRAALATIVTTITWLFWTPQYSILFHHGLAM